MVDRFHWRQSLNSIALSHFLFTLFRSSLHPLSLYLSLSLCMFRPNIVCRLTLSFSVRKTNIDWLIVRFFLWFFIVRLHVCIGIMKKTYTERVKKAFHTKRINSIHVMRMLFGWCVCVCVVSFSINDCLFCALLNRFMRAIFLNHVMLEFFTVYGKPSIRIWNVWLLQSIYLSLCVSLPAVPSIA